MKIAGSAQMYKLFLLFYIALQLATAAKGRGGNTLRRGQKNRQNSRHSASGGSQHDPYSPSYSLDDIDEARIAAWPDEQRLLARLLHDYEPASRPVYNASTPVTVKFGLTLTQIFDMDEVNQVLTTNVWIEQEWQDERLKWDPTEYNNLSTIRIPCQRIWLPDIVLYNSADDFTEGFMQSKAMVRYDGNVFWPPPAKLRSSCKIDITYFPFDDQKCRLKFGSWTYDGFQVDVTNRSEKVHTDNYVYSGEWELLDVRIIRNEIRYPCCIEPYPDVTFFVFMRRRTLYYLFNIIFPCLWLTVLSLLGFWLPPDSGEKITLGITVLLAFSVFMLLIAESMPATSEFVPLIGIYLTVTMAMTSLSIVLTVFVLQLHHVGPNQKPVPRWIKRIVISVIARMLCLQGYVRNHYSNRYATRVANANAHAHKQDTHGGLSSSFVDNNGAKHYQHHHPYKDYNNCNGGLNNVLSNNSNAPAAHLRPLLPKSNLSPGRSNFDQASSHDATSSALNKKDNVIYDRISSQLKILVSKNDSEDEFQDIVNEWRLVAHIMDRFLFWLFLIGAVSSSVSILVLKPMMKPSLL